MWHPKLTKRKYQHNTTEYTREYNTWYSMRMRCLNKFNHNYNRYGGRGIKICDRWINSFDNFVEDMGRRPENTTIDRINNDGNYEPSNCRWATPKEQNRNSSFAVLITDTDGDVLCIDDFAKKHKIPQSTISYRLKNSTDIRDIKKKPTNKQIVRITFKGKQYTGRELRRSFPYAENTYRRRVKAGMSHEKALCEVFNKIGVCCTESDFIYERFNFEYKSLT